MRRILSGLLPCLLLIGCEGRREDNSKVLATMDGERLTEDQFELLLNTLPTDRSREVLNNPEAKREQFEKLVKNRLYSLAAQDMGYGKNEALKERMSTVDKRIVAQYYFQSFLGEQLGATTKELESFYNQHPSMFKGDSGKPKAYAEVRLQVAESLAISRANLDSVYKLKLKNYRQKAFCEVSLIEVKSQKTAESVYEQLKNGLPFKEAVQKFTIHSTKATEGHVGRAYPGEPLAELGQGLNVDSLLFNDGTKIGTGHFSKPFKKDSTWIIAHADSCKAEVVPALAQIHHRVAQDYLQDYRQLLSDSLLSRLKKKYHVVMADLRKPVDSATLMAFYERNKDSYESPETYGVYHLETSKPKLVAAKMKSVKTLEAFKALAAQYSENAWTKADSGKSGNIKRDHCLPYGIGMLPMLWNAFDTLQPGSITGPYFNPESNKSQWFFLTAKYPRKPKSFDRIKALVVKEYQDEAIAQIKPEDTLATVGKKIFRESDVNFLRQEIPPNMRERYSREQLLDYMLTWDLTTMDAEPQGLTKDLKLMALRLENVDNYWAGIFQDSVLAKTYAQDTNELKADFAKYKTTLTRDSNATNWMSFAHDIAALKTLNDSDFQIEYHTYPERYVRDSVSIPFEQARFDIFQNLKPMANIKAEIALLEKLKARVQFKILDTALARAKIKDPLEAYKQAQQFHYDRKLDKALAIYQELREEFPGNAALQDSVCFGIAQIYIEQERYPQAMAEYRRVSYLYPNSPNEYKAEFMVGFIQSEHLKNDSAAVKTFTAMLGKYPKTDLSDDADWMIRNIRSGGKLMPVLEGDSGWVDPDSVKKDKSSK